MVVILYQWRFAKKTYFSEEKLIQFYVLSMAVEIKAGGFAPVLYKRVIKEK